MNMCTFTEITQRDDDTFATITTAELDHVTGAGLLRLIRKGGEKIVDGAKWTKDHALKPAWQHAKPAIVPGIVGAGVSEGWGWVKDRF
jgi:hypothetical protein